MTTLIHEEIVPQEPTQAVANEEVGEKQEATSVRMTERSLHTTVQGNILAIQANGSTHRRIGANGGIYFDDEKYAQGVVVSGIKAWAGAWQLRGIEITFSDGTSIMRGKREGKDCGGITIDYLSGETITALSIWGNGAGTRCGAFIIRTSKGKEFWPQMTQWGLKTEYPMNVGGGVILGVIGGADDDIYNLGFLMLDTVNRTLLTQFEYDLNKVALPEQKYAYDITIPNPSATDSDQGTITREVNRERGGEWFIKAGAKYGQEYTVQGSIPEIAEVGATAKWELSVEAGYTRKWSDNAKENVTIPLIIPALTKTRIVYSYFQGKVDSCPFRATMKYYLSGGGVWDCTVTGFYNGSDATRVIGTSYLLAKWDGTKWIDVDKPQMKILYGGHCPNK